MRQRFRLNRRPGPRVGTTASSAHQGPLNAHAPVPTPEVMWNSSRMRKYSKTMDAGRIDGSLGRGH